MVAKLRGSWRWPAYVCAVGLSLIVLYLCAFNARGQIPPPGPPGMPTIQFSADNFTVTEGDTATITVTLSAASTQTITAGYDTNDGTGQAGVDYTSTTGIVTFPPGSTSQTFNVTTLQDPNNTSYVTVYLTLTATYPLGSPSSATLYIANPSVCP